MRKFVCFFIAIWCNILSFGQTNYCSSIENEYIIQKEYLTISYNKEGKIPNYVGYFITPDMIGGKNGRESSFYADTSIEKKYRSYPSNYTNTGYDRGHMSPAATWKWDKNAMHESFSMANICPQKPSLNRIYWESVEEIERMYALACDTIFIVSGEYGQNKSHIKNNVCVPDYFYKACTGIKKGKVVISVGWIFENTNSKQKEESRKVTIDDIEEEANVDLFYGFWFNEILENGIVRY